MADPTPKGSSSDLAAAVERLRYALDQAKRTGFGGRPVSTPADLRLVLDALDQWRADANRLAAALRSHWGDPCGHPDCPECAALAAHDQLAGTGG